MRTRAWLYGTAAVLGMLALAPAASAAVFRVNTTVDGEDAFTGDTTCADILNRCTLRAAIQQANAQGGPDQVNLPARTYTLGSPLGELTVSSNIVIEGTGTSSNTHIRPAVNGRIFNVTGAGTLDLRDATVRNGVLAADGGGIRSDGSLTLRRVVLANNQAFGENGGGLYANGTTVIVDSTVAGNRAALGGGVLYAGPAGRLTIARSTLSSNTATSDFGGGLYTTSGGEATVINSTVSGNSVGGSGGGMALFADATLEHVTVAGNTSNPVLTAGVEIGDPDTVTFVGSILDNPAGRNCDPFGTAASAGGNVEDGDDCGFDGPGDRPNTDPLLGALQNNGGPTQTRAIASNSPARDAVTSGCPPPATDQRGVARPHGPACDSGAFELSPPSAVLDLSLTAKGKQRAKKLKVEVGCGEVACSVDLEGKSKVPKRAATAAKAIKFKLKPKDVDVAAGGTEVVRLKFKKHRKTVRKIGRLLKQGGKTARKAKVVVEATATGGGDTDTAKEKIKLKR